MRRVASKPLMPGSSTSIRTRSNGSDMEDGNGFLAVADGERFLAERLQHFHQGAREQGVVLDHQNLVHGQRFHPHPQCRAIRAALQVHFRPM